MNARGSRGIAPRVLNLNAVCRLVVKFKSPTALLWRKKVPFHLLTRSIVSSKTDIRTFAEKSLNILTQLRIEQKYPCRTSYSVGTILAEISLLYRL